MRAEIIEMFKRIWNVDLEMQQHAIPMFTSAACAEFFVFPEKASDEDKELLKRAYIQLKEKGYLE